MQSLPNVGDRRLVEEMDGRSILGLEDVVDVVRVCRPGEVVHVLRSKMPRKRVLRYREWFLGIPVADVLGILEHTGSADHVLGGQRDTNVERTKGGVELAADVRIGMPSALVVGRHFRIPLAHRVIDAFPIITAASARLQRDL